MVKKMTCLGCGKSYTSKNAIKRGEGKMITLYCPFCKLFHSEKINFLERYRKQKEIMSIPPLQEREYVKELQICLQKQHPSKYKLFRDLVLAFAIIDYKQDKMVKYAR